jgi:hypothetical protein
MSNTRAIAFRSKIVVDTNRSVKAQVGRVQRGQWVWINGMNARVLNMIGNFITLFVFDRKTGERHVLQYA